MTKFQTCINACHDVAYNSFDRPGILDSRPIPGFSELMGAVFNDAHGVALESLQKHFDSKLNFDVIAAMFKDEELLESAENIT